MPTPNLQFAHGVGGTPPPSMPLSHATGTSQTRKKLPVKRAKTVKPFTAPRPKKK